MVGSDLTGKTAQLKVGSLPTASAQLEGLIARIDQADACLFILAQPKGVGKDLPVAHRIQVGLPSEGSQAFFHLRIIHQWISIVLQLVNALVSRLLCSVGCIVQMPLPEYALHPGNEVLIVAIAQGEIQQGPRRISFLNIPGFEQSGCVFRTSVLPGGIGDMSKRVVASDRIGRGIAREEAVDVALHREGAAEIGLRHGVLAIDVVRIGP